MKETIILFSLDESIEVSENQPTCLDDGIFEIEKTTKRVLTSIAKTFEKRLKYVAQFDIHCQFGKIFIPNDVTIKHGVSLHINNAQILQPSLVNDFRELCKKEVQRLKILSENLDQLAKADEKVAGSTNTKKWFEIKKSSDRNKKKNYAYRTDLELCNSIRRIPILENLHLKLNITDDDSVELRIPAHTAHPTIEGNEKKRVIKINSASRESSTCEAYVDGKSSKTLIKIPEELSKKIFVAFKKDKMLKVEVVSVHSYLNGKKIIDRLELKKITGSTKNKQRNIF